MWDIYLQLEATIKNMITALRAVTELQNPALRMRHWKQLMEAANVTYVVLVLVVAGRYDASVHI